MSDGRRTGPQRARPSHEDHPDPEGALLMSTQPRIRVLIVDDHPLFREGLMALLRDEPDIVLVGEAADGREALERFRTLRPDVTLMDLQLPGMSGIEAMQLIRREFPEARFVVLTTYSRDAQVMRALQAGAAGYLVKSSLRKELLSTVRAVYLGEKSISSEVAIELAEHVLDEAPSQRELEVLKLIADGTSNREIAVSLGLTESTVKSHVKNVMAKLGANDRTHAVLIAIRRGFIDG
jgi:DNA-binding NarL/FixJ family response regulator